MKIRLRQLEYEDLESLRDWRNSDEIRGGTREYRLLNLVNQKDWFERVSRDKENEMFGIEVYKKSQHHFGIWELIGVCGLCYINWISRNAEISIYIGNENYRHRGIEVQALGLLKDKAFSEYNLQRLWAEVYAFNEYNIQLLEQSGFVYEGRLRRHVFKLGRYHDSLIYALLCDEEVL